MKYVSYIGIDGISPNPISRPYIFKRTYGHLRKFSLEFKCFITQYGIKVMHLLDEY